MVIKSLSLKEFRNYSCITFDFLPGVNFIHGNNGQGKTNLVESLFFSTHLKSYRTSKLHAICKSGHDSAWIQTMLSKQKVDHELSILIERGRKRVVLDGKTLLLTSEFVRSFISLLFAPDQLVFFKEYPLERRAFFDRVLFLIDGNYHLWIKEFNRIKKQKCIVLKKRSDSDLDVWNRLLSEIIPKITQARQEVTVKINQSLTTVFQELTGRKGTLLLSFRSDLQGKVDLNASEIYNFLSGKKEKEYDMGYLLYGSHRDDYWLSLDQKKDRYTFSQGEYRISFLALQLAINKIIGEEMKFNPILLLDDIFSELDEPVSRRSIEYISQNKNQMFITSTSIPQDILKTGTSYRIESGKLVN